MRHDQFQLFGFIYDLFARVAAFAILEIAKRQPRHMPGNVETQPVNRFERDDVGQPQSEPQRKTANDDTNQRGERMPANESQVERAIHCSFKNAIHRPDRYQLRSCRQSGQ